MATKTVITQTNSLGKAQAALEAATKELKSAQSAYERISERLALAEEAHQLATTVLIVEVIIVCSNVKVVLFNLK